MNAQVHQAIDLAMKAHAGQMRHTGEAYIEHPLSVLTLLINTGVQLPLPAYLAAVLHDTLEDTSLTYEGIVQQCGAETAEMVRLLTKTERPKGVSHRHHVRGYIADIRSASFACPSILLIKMADCIHNLHTIEGHYDRKQVEIIAEITDLFYPLFQERAPERGHPFFACHHRLLKLLRESLEQAFRLHDIRIQLD